MHRMFDNAMLAVAVLVGSLFFMTLGVSAVGLMVLGVMVVLTLWEMGGFITLSVILLLLVSFVCTFLFLFSNTRKEFRNG